MKNFSLALLLISVISFSFIVGSKAPPATPIHFDDVKTGSTSIYNLCTGEDVDITYRSRFILRGSMNGQNIIVKAQLNEQQDGIGRLSGTKYIGHINQSDNQSGSFVNGSFSYAQNVSVRMVSPGNGGNFKSNVNLRYAVNSNGQVTAERAESASDCQ